MDECEVVPATQQGYVVAGSTATIQPVPVPTPKEGECLIRVCANRELKPSRVLDCCCSPSRGDAGVG